MHIRYRCILCSVLCLYFTFLLPLFSQSVSQWNAWPATGRSALQDLRSCAILQASLALSPVSSSICCNCHYWAMQNKSIHKNSVITDYNQNYAQCWRHWGWLEASTSVAFCRCIWRSINVHIIIILKICTIKRWSFLGHPPPYLCRDINNVLPCQVQLQWLPVQSSRPCDCFDSVTKWIPGQELAAASLSVQRYLLLQNL